MKPKKIPAPLKTISIGLYNWQVLLFDDRAAYDQYIRATLPAKLHDEYCVGDFRPGCPLGRTITDFANRHSIVGIFGNGRGEAASAGTIAHEMLHVVTVLFDNVGIPIRNEIDEPAAYLLQNLVDEAFPAITRNYTIQLNKEG